MGQPFFFKLSEKSSAAMDDCVSSGATEFLRHTIQSESPITPQMNSGTVIWKRDSHVEGIQQATSEIIANSIQKWYKAREGIRISSLGQKCALITECKRPHGMMMGFLE